MMNQRFAGFFGTDNHTQTLLLLYKNSKARIKGLFYAVHKTCSFDELKMLRQWMDTQFVHLKQKTFQKWSAKITGGFF